MMFIGNMGLNGNCERIEKELREAVSQKLKIKLVNNNKSPFDIQTEQFHFC